MKHILPLIILFLLSSCTNFRVSQINKEVLKIQNLKDTLEYVEIDDLIGGDRTEWTWITYQIDQDSSIRRVHTSLSQGSQNLDTIYEYDYYYAESKVIYADIKEVIRSIHDTNILHDCQYYIHDLRLFQAKCQTGNPKDHQTLIHASEMTFQTTLQLMQKIK